MDPVLVDDHLLMMLKVLVVRMKVLLLLLVELLAGRRSRRRRCQPQVAIFDRRRRSAAAAGSAHSTAAILVPHNVATPFRPGVLEPNLRGTAKNRLTFFSTLALYRNNEEDGPGEHVWIGQSFGPAA